MRAEMWLQVANASSEGKVLVKEYEAISSSEGDAHQKVVVTLLSKEDGRRPLYAAILASPDSHKVSTPCAFIQTCMA